MKRFATIFVALLASTALAQPGGSPPNGPPPNGESATAPPPNPSNAEQTRTRNRRQGRPPQGVTTLPEQVPPTTGRPSRPGRPGGGGPPAVQPMPMPTPPVRPVPPVARPPFTTPNPWHRPTASQWFWHGRWVNRIRGPAFVWPPGHPYVRRTVGQFLPSVFLQPRFWFDAVGPLGLPRAPIGFRWIRHGPDLLLVNMRTGRIVDVAWGVFFF